VPDAGRADRGGAFGAADVSATVGTTLVVARAGMVAAILAIQISKYGAWGGYTPTWMR